jgi:HAD superfamily hydrolase (TIGR01490 family)
MKYAFFDVDNTIYDGYTASELLFYMTENGYCAKRLHDRYLQAVIDYDLRKINYNEISQIALDIVSAALEGKGIKESKEFVKSMLEKKSKVFNAWVEPVMKYLKKNDFTILLVSAGPDLIIEEIAKMVNADKWYATKIEAKNGKYTGAECKLINEDAKSEIMNTLRKDKDLETTIGFGDSTGDIPMLKRVDLAFVVKNDHHKEMMEYAEFAKEKGWTVFSNADEVIKVLEGAKKLGKKK